MQLWKTHIFVFFSFSYSIVFWYTFALGKSLNNFFSVGKRNESLGLEPVTHEEVEETAKHFQLIPSDLRFLLLLFLIKVCPFSTCFEAHKNRTVLLSWYFRMDEAYLTYYLIWSNLILFGKSRILRISIHFNFQLSISMRSRVLSNVEDNNVINASLS